MEKTIIYVSVGVAVMSLQNPPVNSLSLDFLTELCIAVEKLEMDKSCRGLIITSVKYNFLFLIFQNLLVENYSFP